MAKPTDDDYERVRLLEIVSRSKDGLQRLSLDQLVRLEALLKKKDYTHNKKALKSKTKLLGKINVRIYELTEGKGIWSA